MKKKHLKIRLIALLVSCISVVLIVIVLFTGTDRRQAGETAASSNQTQEQAEEYIESVPVADEDPALVEKYTNKYGRFVLVDISDQILRYFEDGAMVLEADVITGTKGKKDTPQGEHSIYNKVEDAKIKGADFEYDVKYWIGFIGTEYGLHDAYWQTEKQFRSRIAYLTEGSHGCVNMMEEDIAKLYKLVKVGDAVIIKE